MVVAVSRHFGPYGRLGLWNCYVCMLFLPYMLGGDPYHPLAAFLVVTIVLHLVMTCMIGEKSFPLCFVGEKTKTLLLL